MCSISYFSKNYFKKNIKTNIVNFLKKIEERGIDSLGILSLEQNKRKVMKCMPSVPQSQLNDKLLNDYKNKIEEISSACLIHLRKASIGDKTLRNAHPYIGEKFILSQNGTSRDLHSFFKEKAALENFEINKYWESDSAALLSYIEERGIKTLEDIVNLLNLIKDDLWIIFVYDKEEGTALIYSDAERELYVQIEDNKLIRAENYKNEEEKNFYYDWYIIFNFETSVIIKKEWEIIKRHKTQTTFSKQKDIYWGIYWGMWNI